jgi:hypothetical protein
VSPVKNGFSTGFRHATGKKTGFKVKTSFFLGSVAFFVVPMYSHGPTPENIASL